MGFGLSWVGCQLFFNGGDCFFGCFFDVGIGDYQGGGQFYVNGLVGLFFYVLKWGVGGNGGGVQVVGVLVGNFFFNVGLFKQLCVVQFFVISGEEGLDNGDCCGG